LKRHAHAYHPSPREYASYNFQPGAWQSENGGEQGGAGPLPARGNNLLMGDFAVIASLLVQEELSGVAYAAAVDPI